MAAMSTSSHSQSSASHIFSTSFGSSLQHQSAMPIVVPASDNNSANQFTSMLFGNNLSSSISNNNNNIVNSMINSSVVAPSVLNELPEVETETTTPQQSMIVASSSTTAAAGTSAEIIPRDVLAQVLKVFFKSLY